MKSLKQRYNRILALAGVLQAACLVKHLAWKGNINQAEFETCIYSIFQTNPATVEDVYGSKQALVTGLQNLINLLSDGKNLKDPDVARYTISLLHLERLLVKNPAMINALQRGVERAKNQAAHFSNTHENVIANLASVYSDTLSTFKFRIHVSGENTHLSNHNIVNKVRAVLLAGVRSSVLWRQLGGTRWQLVFGKRTMLHDAQTLLKEMQGQPA
jgi:high frequency lysogenization protein